MPSTYRNDCRGAYKASSFIVRDDIKPNPISSFNTIKLQKTQVVRSEAKNSRGVLNWRVMRASSPRAVSVSIKASDKRAFVDFERQVGMEL